MVTPLACFFYLFGMALIQRGECSGHGRKNLAIGVMSSARNLLDVSVIGITPFTITASGNKGQGQCFINGYPGSMSDQAVKSPLVISVPPYSGLTTVSLQRGANAYFQYYNYSSPNLVTLSQNSSYGLSSITFNALAASQNSTILSGYISGSDAFTDPTCLLNITFITASPPPPPPPSPPPPPPSPPPPSPPPPAQVCTGILPCYCQGAYCFNNGATLSNTCIPPSGTSCVQVTVPPSAIGVQYAYGYPASVNVCMCSPTVSTAG